MRILHVSDLHFGKRDATKYPTESAHYFADATHRVPVPEKLAEILAKEAKLRSLDAIVASGDIGWSGCAEDYGFAVKFVSALRERVDVPLVVCPGNHDVDFSRGIESAARQDAFLDFLRSVHNDQFDTVHALLKLGTTSDRRRHYISGLHRFPDKNLTILTVNSAAGIEPPGDKCGMCRQERRERAPILVDPQVLQEWESRLPPSTEGDLRILVVHHHLFPFAEPIWTNNDDPIHPPDRADPTILANSARLQPWLARNGFSLVLHGHKHQTHARHDVLMRRGDPERGWEILVLGAGSTGVAQDQRAGGEPLNYYVLECHRLRRRAFSIGVESKTIARADVSYTTIPDKPKFVREIGEQLSRQPAVYHAENMADCYRAFRSVLKDGDEVTTNFISIVEESKFELPNDALLFGDPVTLADITNSFETLHPEYDPQRGWTSGEEVKRILSDLPHRYSFQHGARLFSYPVAPPSGPPVKWIEPLERAISSVPGHTSRAFVGLYNPFIDAHPESAIRSPPPCLTSIQFVPESRQLHLVATFRKLELSFWWLVNMYEMIKILEHAVSAQKNKIAGRITFFSTLAEWHKDNPQPAFSARLDKQTTPEMVRLLLAVDRASQHEIQALRILLAEKQKYTNENNIDERGLHQLSVISDGILRSRDNGSLTHTTVANLAAAATHLIEARKTEHLAETRANIKGAREKIQLVLTELDRFS
ncbi:MAG TPA: metallophosphoesterase [Kofleriaceae bacterium]|jgi:3',5'-cyclic AMP phosphodiesterase CpdA|nr:metallophosphoesterase [Kofleriaceae bacterium]